MKSINLKFLFLLVLFGSFKTVYAQENTGGLIIDKIIGRVEESDQKKLSIISDNGSYVY